jgi:HemK-like putative methylase
VQVVQVAGLISTEASDLDTQHQYAPTTIEMPRIPSSLLRKAHTIDPLLPPLLAPCRDLHAAQSELRWLREHVDKVATARQARGDRLAKGALLRQLIKQRVSGKPLQYILGTEYFGDLEIRCRPGVLIPRWVRQKICTNEHVLRLTDRQDTAASVTYLARLLCSAKQLPPELRLLDLCTGTGCIPLLFRHELYSARDDVTLHALGVDVSEEAIRLASDNISSVGTSKALRQDGEVKILHADVLSDPFADQVSGPLPLKAALNLHSHPVFWDILISNPPYISPSGYWKTTARSVRGYEPTLALVPPHQTGQDDIQQGDMFYPRLLDIARDVEAKVVLLEVADLEQAHRIAQRAHELDIFDGVEIWREDPSSPAEDSPAEEHGFKTIGQGNARSVLCWRGLGSSWLGKAAGQFDAKRLFRSSTGKPLPGRSISYDTASLQPQFDRSIWKKT